jgi:hypothetical protein
MRNAKLHGYKLLSINKLQNRFARITVAAACGARTSGYRFLPAARWAEPTVIERREELFDETAGWTAQQFRMIGSGEQTHRFVIHDRDTIYSEGVDRTLAAMGLTVLRTPVRAPQANAFCERLIGTIRREWLDFMIPMSERHVRAILREWVRHYNSGRRHASLGPGIPGRPVGASVGFSPDRRLPTGYRVTATPILGGLHHEYGLAREAA